MSALLPGPGIEIEVALGIGQSGLSGAWDSGTFGATVWGSADTSLGDWVDVTCFTVDGVSLSAGATSADGVVTRWEAATAALTLFSTAFDPRSGPWAGLLGPGIPVRIRWRMAGAPDWVIAFNGYTDDDGFSYDPKSALATLAATDGTRILNAFDGLEQGSQGQGETAAQRVTRIADMAGWPADLRDIEDGGVAVQATTLAENAWTMLLAVADTDLALLWVNRAGELAYRPQGKVKPRQQVSAVIACDPSEGSTVIRPVQMEGQQPTITRNIVSISRQSTDGGDDAVTVTVRDEESISRYLAHTYQRTDLIHIDDNWSDRIAGTIVATSAWPSTAPQSTDFDSRLDPGAGPLLLALEPSLSILVDDGITQWECEPAGWQVQIWRNRIEGSIDWLDVTQWVNVGWDTATWDTDSWGF